MSADARVAWAGRVAVLMLPAEVDISNADQVREDLAGLVAQQASLVVADMTTTTFCDSAGVSALVRAMRKATAAGARLRVATTAPAVTRVLAITGVDQLIEVYPSVAAATAGAVEGRTGTAGQAGPDERARQAGPDERAGQAAPDERAAQPS